MRKEKDPEAQKHSYSRSPSLLGINVHRSGFDLLKKNQQSLGNVEFQLF
jgi:hypothetical protein